MLFASFDICKVVITHQWLIGLSKPDEALRESLSVETREDKAQREQVCPEIKCESFKGCSWLLLRPAR